MKVDIVILGSGFSGSLLAWILAKSGRKVALLDRQTHPRFAIGESSTPLADFLLERIANEFDLPELKPLSRWGSWQAIYPQIRGGKKRGFSYFYHKPGQSFSDGPNHENSWLVAASSHDKVSDTHWLRADVDHWLCHRAVQNGVTLLSPWEVLSIDHRPTGQTDGRSQWEILCRRLEDKEQHSTPESIKCEFLVDATGGGGLLGKSLGIRSLSESMRVRTQTIFGHFTGVTGMSEWVAEHTDSDCTTPFDADDAAQHHILNNGWLWMLRFAEGTTSVGLVLNDDQSIENPETLWRQTLSDYPTLQSLLEDAKLANDTAPNGLRSISRISRLWSQAAGDDWLMLPGTAGVVDPLHSTGIAHGLHGVSRAAEILLSHSANSSRERLRDYSASAIREIQWIDQLVACAYLAMKIDSQAFEAACSLYFVCAIHCEREMAETGQMQSGFLCCNHASIRALVNWFEEQIRRLTSAPLKSEATSSEAVAPPLTVSAFIAEFRQRLAPWNDVGLMESRRIARSSAPK